MFRNNDEWLSIDVTLNQDQDAAVDYQYERAVNEPKSVDVNGTEVLIYGNSRNGSIYAAWVKDNANYSLYGVLTEQELVQIIESMNTTEG